LTSIIVSPLYIGLQTGCPPVALPTRIITETSARYHWVDQMFARCFKILQSIIWTSNKVKHISDAFNGIVYSFAKN